MDRDRVKNIGKATSTAVLATVGFGLGIWISLILTDILTFVWAYFFAQNLLEIYVRNIYLVRLGAVIFAGIVTWFTGTILWNIVKRNRKWVVILALIMAACFVAMYFVSSPYSSGLFNPFSGKAQATYLRLPDGTIKIFPKGLKFDPETSQELKVLDRATAEEYKKQQGEGEIPPSMRPSKPGRIVSTDELDNLEIWVEKIQAATDRTILFIACKGRNGAEGWLSSDGPEDSATYLVDVLSGQTYNLVSGTQAYDETTIHLIMRDVGFFKTDYQLRPITIKAHHVRVDEVYRFALTFKPIPPGVVQIKLHVKWSESTLDLSQDFAKAERISPVGQSKSPELLPARPEPAEASSTAPP